MSFTLKSDVKSHLSARGRARNHPFISPSQPDATGFSEAEPGESKADPPGFVEDFVGEHSPRGISIVPAAPLVSATGVQAPDVTRSPQE
jgi:hypothetical protein